MHRSDTPRRRLRTMRRRMDYLRTRIASRDIPNVSFEVDEYYALEWAIKQLTPLFEQYVPGHPIRKPKLVPKDD